MDSLVFRFRAVEREVWLAETGDEAAGAAVVGSVADAAAPPEAGVVEGGGAATFAA